MEHTQNINEYIATQMSGEMERKGKSPMLWIILTLIGVAAIVACFARGLSDSMQTLLLTVGVIALGVGVVFSVLCFTKTLWHYKYLPTGSPVSIKTVYLNTDDYRRCREALAENRHDILNTLTPQISTNSGVTVVRSRDAALVLLQAGRYDTGVFEPESPVVRLQADEAKTFALGR